jgi:putative ABC transport system permease protein
MHLLDRKLLRDLRAGRRQFFAVSLVVMLGITLYIGSASSFENLHASYDRSYRELGFADFTVSCERAPESVVDRARELPGVFGVVGRWSEEVTIEKPRAKERQVYGRVISMPDRGTPAVNRVLIREGAPPRGPRDRALLLESQFAQYHGYRPGSTIRLVVDGEEEDYRVAGLVSSPEYIIVVRSKEYQMPMAGMFGVMYMAHTQAEELFQEAGRINELCVRCDPRRRAALVRHVEGLLKPYGGQDAILQEDQPSNHLLQDDVKSFKAMAYVLPTVFLMVAGLTTYTLLTRLVHAQRRQIGLLRAEGFAAEQILGHYLKAALAIGVMGSASGLLVGYGLGALTTTGYVTMLNVPLADVRPRPHLMLEGLAAGLLCSLVGGWLPARAAMRLLPAEALRPEPPPAGRALAPERWLPGFASLRVGARLPLRNLVRNPRRTFYTVLGVAASVAIVLATGSLSDGTNAIMERWFHGMQRYDLRVSFIPAQSEGIGPRVASWQGVRHVEPILEIPVEIEANGQTRSTLLVGLPPANVLFGLFAHDGEPTHVDPRGFLAGASIDRVFHLEPGDTARVRYPKSVEEIRLEHPLRFARRLDMPFGMMIYAPLDRVQRAYGERLDLPPKPITGLLITADPEYREEIRKHLYDLPNAAAVEVTENIRAQIDEMLKFNWIFIGVLTAFGSALAFAIVYNTVSMAVLERSREIATLRTLGMRRREIALMITAENALIGIAGALLGIPGGLAFAYGLLLTYTNEQLTMSFVIYPRTYAIVLLGILGVLFIAQIPSLRHAARLDLASATKDMAD